MVCIIYRGQLLLLAQYTNGHAIVMCFNYREMKGNIIIDQAKFIL